MSNIDKISAAIIRQLRSRTLESFIFYALIFASINFKRMAGEKQEKISITAQCFQITENCENSGRCENG